MFGDTKAVSHVVFLHSAWPRLRLSGRKCGSMDIERALLGTCVLPYTAIFLSNVVETLVDRSPPGTGVIPLKCQSVNLLSLSSRLKLTLKR